MFLLPEHPDTCWLAPDSATVGAAAAYIFVGLNMFLFPFLFSRLNFRHETRRTFFIHPPIISMSCFFYLII
jgi:hypothetical protein